jgi:hypothetical protein
MNEGPQIIYVIVPIFKDPHILLGKKKGAHNQKEKCMHNIVSDKCEK